MSKRIKIRVGLCKKETRKNKYRVSMGNILVLNNSSVVSVALAAVNKAVCRYAWPRFGPQPHMTDCSRFKYPATDSLSYPATQKQTPNRTTKLCRAQLLKRWKKMNTRKWFHDYYLHWWNKQSVSSVNKRDASLSLVIWYYDTTTILRKQREVLELISFSIRN